MYIVDFDEYRRSGVIDCLEYVLTSVRVSKFDTENHRQKFEIGNNQTIKVDGKYLSYSEDNGFFFSNTAFYWRFFPSPVHPKGVYIEHNGLRIYNDRGRLVLILPSDVLTGTIWILDEPKKQIISESAGTI